MTGALDLPSDRAVVVLDDDPTGTQSSSHVPVLLDPDADPAPLLARDDALHILTNTRAVSRSDAVALLTRIRDRVSEACRELGLRPEFVLRGDSTLRGHVFAESDVFAEAHGVLLFVPAFPAGGRTTVDGVHRLELDGVPVPVADTEFARDPVFGYRAHTLPEWVREVGDREGVSLPLDRVRRGPDEVARSLTDAPAGSVVLPDACTDTDLEIISAGLDRARADGRHVVLRCAAPLAAIRSGRAATGFLPRPVAGLHRPRTLVVCGSHTAASGRQLAALSEALQVPARLLDTDDALGDPDAAAGRLAGVLGDDFDRHGLALLASQRERRPEHNQLEHGAAVMTALCSAVERVAGGLEAVISKGGITSADVARRGLGASSATVLGPVLAGIPVWTLPRDDGGTVIYVVVPGNVGDDRTLVDVASALSLPTENP